MENEERLMKISLEEFRYLVIYREVLEELGIAFAVEGNYSALEDVMRLLRNCSVNIYNLQKQLVREWFPESGHLDIPRIVNDFFQNEDSEKVLRELKVIAEVTLQDYDPDFVKRLAKEDYDLLVAQIVQNAYERYQIFGKY